MIRRKKRSFKRSGYEDTVAKKLDALGITYKYEETKIKYLLERKYITDFKLEGFFVESKGYFTSSDRTKHLRIKEQHPDIDIRFLFMADNWLTKKKKSRYSDWCKRNGFRYHVSPTGDLPKAWIKEIVKE